MFCFGYLNLSSSHLGDDTVLSLSEELLNASMSWFEIEETGERHRRPLDEVSDLYAAYI